MLTRYCLQTTNVKLLDLRLLFNIKALSMSLFCTSGVDSSILIVENSSGGREIKLALVSGGVKENTLIHARCCVKSVIANRLLPKADG